VFEQLEVPCRRELQGIQVFSQTILVLASAFKSARELIFVKAATNARKRIYWEKEMTGAWSGQYERYQNWKEQTPGHTHSHQLRRGQPLFL
jgi:hypothetical protein